MSKTLNVAHFVSWWGTTMAYVAEKANKWELWDIRSRLVIASKSGIWAIEKATKLWIHHEVVNHKNANEILRHLVHHNIDIIMQNGWIPLTLEEIVRAYQQEGKFEYNQHPGGLRADRVDFWGKGMIGTRVTAAKVFYLLAHRHLGEYAFTECSVHKLTEKLDDGVLVGAKVLDITSELDTFQAQYWNLEYWEDIILSPALDALITWEKDTTWEKIQPWIQDKLLPLEHLTVAEVMRTLWEWSVPQRHPIYDTSLGMDISGLDWARKQAIKLYPNG